MNTNQPSPQIAENPTTDEQKTGFWQRKATCRTAREGLTFYADGTVKIYDETATTAQALVDEGVLNTLSFGPALVDNGTILDGIEDVEVDTNFGNHSIQGNQPRTAVGYIDTVLLFVLVGLGLPVIPAVIIARCVSALANFALNRLSYARRRPPPRRLHLPGALRPAGGRYPGGKRRAHGVPHRHGSALACRQDSGGGGAGAHQLRGPAPLGLSREAPEPQPQNQPRAHRQLRSVETLEKTKPLHPVP